MYFVTGIEYQIRYFHCGEYGEKTSRPHYHVILFNTKFHDQRLHSNTRGNEYYISRTLSEAWQYKGHCIIGEANYQTISYCARYIMKKINGAQASLTDHYFCKETGLEQIPEYTTMSRNPGLGTEFYKQYKSDIFPSDECVIRTSKNGPPMALKPPKF